MQGQSFEEWFAALPERQRDRCRRMVAELDMHGKDPDVRQRVRADMEQHHAPLAFETFFNCVHPGEWTLAAKYQIQELLGRDTLAWQERYGPHIKPGTEAVDRIIANGNSYEDLAAFAFLVAAAKVQDVGFTLSHGEFFADLPGWRLMETWHGVLTGRALSIWGVYQAQLAGGPGATARDGSPLPEVQRAWGDLVPLEPDGPADGTASIPIAPNPALTDRPRIGPAFWDAVRRARLKELKSRQSPGRGEPRTKTRVRRSELGEAVLCLLAELRDALEHGGNLELIEKGVLTPTGSGTWRLEEDAFERLLAVPLRTIVALLSAAATAGPGSSPPGGRRRS